MSISGLNVSLGILATALLLTGCTSVRATTFDTHAASARFTEPADIRFYETQRPRCEYREVGHITTTRNTWLTSWSSAVRKTRERASQMGGDAIVSFRESSRISGATISHGGISTHESNSISGTVIRFTNRNCRE
jgi:hypothetical protein